MADSPFSIEAFRNSVCLKQFRSVNFYENIIAILRNCSLWMMNMELLRCNSTSTVFMSLPIHYLIISVKWLENPSTPACSTSPVVDCTNNKWFKSSRDFCRQIVPVILAILHRFILKRVKHIREVVHVKIKTGDNKNQG